MYLDSAKKQEIFGKYGASNTDTGSAESQIALFSYRIAHLPYCPLDGAPQEEPQGPRDTAFADYPRRQASSSA